MMSHNLRLRGSLLLQSRYGAILLIVGLNILVGALIAPRYGEAWDERIEVVTGQRAVGAYRGIVDYSIADPNNYYGPFYDVLSQGIVNLFAIVKPAWKPFEVHHFTNFLAFQLAILTLYSLCTRFVSKPAALGATLLFASQPVLFGHAFINPKDGPFMAFFLASVVSGLAMVAAYERQGPDGVHDGLRDLWSSAGREWRSKGVALKTLLVILSVVAFVTLLDVLLADRLVFGLVRNALSSTAQISQWTVTYPRVQVPIVMAAFMPAALVGAFVFVRTVNRLWANRFTRYLILGSLLMGWATSMRFIGPFAGTLVSAYFLSRVRARAVAPLAVYWIVAGFVTFSSWPFLWDAPVGRYLETIRVMGNFPWEGAVLYRGIIFESNHDLPALYVPYTMGLQITETALTLTAIGLIVAVRRLWTGKIDRTLLILLTVWFGLPLAAQITLKIPVYDNFRHFLYILPPLFMLGSIGQDAILGLLRHDALKAFAIALTLLPGILGIIRLHPYEYTYYNALAGGTRGASGSYELDYWCTSYQEMFAHVNDVAEPGAVIAVWGPYHLAETRLRDDLEMYGISSQVRPGWLDTRTPDYAVICARADLTEWLYGDAEPILQVQRGGAALSVLRRVD